MKAPSLNPFARNLLILAAVALLIIVLNQEIALATVGALLSFVFFIALAVAAYFLWRDFGRREIGMWPRRPQLVFYSAIALLVADVGAWMLGGPNGRQALALILVAGGGGAAGRRTWREQQRLS